MLTKSHTPALCPHATLNVRLGTLHIALTTATPSIGPPMRLTMSLNAVDIEDA
jgi:hypothetical protein